MAKPTLPLVDLRGKSPRHVIDVIDAVSTQRRMTRLELVNEILESWADDRTKELIAVARVTGILRDESKGGS